MTSPFKMASTSFRALIKLSCGQPRPQNAAAIEDMALAQDRAPPLRWFFQLPIASPAKAGAPYLNAPYLSGSCWLSLLRELNDCIVPLRVRTADVDVHTRVAERAERLLQDSKILSGHSDPQAAVLQHNKLAGPGRKLISLAGPGQ